MYKNSYLPKCRYFAQGRCSFGSNCKFSHDGFQQIYLMRHAQSLFNSYSDNMKGENFHSLEAKNLFQLNQKLIDCGLTQNGKIQAQKTQIPSQCFHRKRKIKQDQIVDIKVIDIVFVSPLNRALQTIYIVLKKNKVKAKRIIVLPQLSQVLSKVCDFSLSTQQKKKKYQKFNFEQLENLQEKLKKNQQFWQDILLDKQYQSQILKTEYNGKRYMKILERIFPTPLQNSENCFERAIIALQKIKKISEKEKAEKIFIVSHNRILKYMCGRNNNGRASSFQNCEMRKILVQTD